MLTFEQKVQMVTLDGKEYKILNQDDILAIVG